MSNYTTSPISKVKLLVATNQDKYKYKSEEYKTIGVFSVNNLVLYNVINIVDIYFKH